MPYSSRSPLDDLLGAPFRSSPWPAVCHSASLETLFWVAALWLDPFASGFYALALGLASGIPRPVPVGLRLGSLLSLGISFWGDGLLRRVEGTPWPLAFASGYFRVRPISQAIPAVPLVPAPSSPFPARRRSPCGFRLLAFLSIPFVNL